MAPAASVHLPRQSAFIPGYESALAIIDLLTAALPLNQFADLRRLSSLVVASAYLLNTLLIVAHALSFPGVFAQAGLFGDAQTTAWLYVFWHGAFPLLILLTRCSPAHGAIASHRPSRPPAPLHWRSRPSSSLRR